MTTTSFQLPPPSSKDLLTKLDTTTTQKNNPHSPSQASHSATPTPTSHTAPLTSIKKPPSCYLCDEQNPGDFTPTTKYLETCLLCNRDFCPLHKDNTHSGICRTNHSRYYHQRLDLARREVADSDAPSHEGRYREAEAKDILLKAGIHPSLGEREKMIWCTSPVFATMRDMENFRALDAEKQGVKDHRQSSLIETKEVIGADIAV